MRCILLFLLSFLFMSEVFSDYERRDPFEDTESEAKITINATQDGPAAKITFISATKDKFGLAHAQNGKDLWFNLDALFSEKARLKLIHQLQGWVSTIGVDGQNFYLKMKGDFLYEAKDIENGVEIILTRPQTTFVTVQEKDPEGQDKGPMVDIAQTKVMAPLVTLHEGSRNTAIQFLWPKEVTTSEFETTDSIIVTVSDPITDAAAIESLIRRVPTWVSGVRVFYDTFEIQIAEGKRARAQKIKNGVLIQVNDVFKGILEELRDEEINLEGGTPEIREARFRGEALLAAEKLLESRERFKGVLDDTPNNVGAIRYLAQVEEQLGRWRQALTLYDAVLESDESPYDVKAKARILQEYGDSVMHTARYQKVQGQDRQVMNTTTGRLAFITGLDIETEIEHRLAQIDDLLRPDGQRGAFKGSAVRMSTVLGYDHERRFRTEIGVHGAKSGAGLFLSESYAWKKSKTTLEGNINKPEWGFIQGISEHGSLDDIKLTHQHFFHERFNILGFAGFNKYNFKKKSNVASTIRYGGEVNYTFNTPSPLFYNSLNPEVFVGYRMDGEYRLSRKQGLDLFAETFDLLPLVAKREVHTVSARISSQLPGYFRGDLVGGYSYDRYGGHGWLMNGKLYYEPFPTLQAGISAGREPSLTRGGAGNIVMYGEGFLKVRF